MIYEGSKKADPVPSATVSSNLSNLEKLEAYQIEVYLAPERDTHQIPFENFVLAADLP